MHERWFSVIVSRLRVSSVLMVLIVCLAVVDVLLFVENRTLNTRLATIQTRDTEVTLGRRLSPISGVNLDQRLESVPTGTPLLVLTFSPGCTASRANHLGWKRLDSLLRGGERKVVWISRDPLLATSEYLSKDRPAGIVLIDVPHRVYAQLALRFVPQTTAIGRDGIVERVWRGKIGEMRWREIDEFLKIATTDAGSRQSMGEPSVAEIGRLNRVNLKGSDK